MVAISAWPEFKTVNRASWSCETSTRSKLLAIFFVSSTLQIQLVSSNTRIWQVQSSWRKEQDRQRPDPIQVLSTLKMKSFLYLEVVRCRSLNGIRALTNIALRRISGRLHPVWTMRGMATVAVCLTMIYLSFAAIMKQSLLAVSSASMPSEHCKMMIRQVKLIWSNGN